MFALLAGGPAEQIIGRDLIVVAQDQQMPDGHLVFPHLIPRIDLLRGTENLGHLLLGQAAILPQFPNAHFVIVHFTSPIVLYRKIWAKISYTTNMMLKLYVLSYFR